MKLAVEQMTDTLGFKRPYGSSSLGLKTLSSSNKGWIIIAERYKDIRDCLHSTFYLCPGEIRA